MEREFNFPVEPYPVQIEFMRNLSDCLSNCKVGIFESPTGTGKSLSMICSSFKWLRENANQSDPNFTGSQSWVNEVPESAVLSEITNTLDPLKKVEDIKPPSDLKIIYISRTHTQLDQFVNEIKRTTWNNDIKVIRLGSRAQLCVNPEIAELKSRGLIDMKCKELIDQDNTSICPYYRAQGILKKHALEKVCDIEDLVTYGRAHKSCAYFGTHSAIPQAEVILAPYTLVLHKKNREAVGIDLQNSVLLIDEAHNIIEAMIDCHSASLTKVQAENSLAAVKNYYERFAIKLGAKSAMYFEQILHFLQAILSFIIAHSANSKQSSSISIGDFLLETQLERMDFFKVSAYIDEIELTRKVTSLAERSGNRNGVSSVPYFIEFLRMLCDDISDGKILINANEQEAGIRYLLLNPNKKFQELAEEARCVVLAGGTMEPKQEYLDLFTKTPKSQIKLFSCKHVMSPNNLLVGVVAKGESGADFRFTYDNRDNIRIMNDLGNLLLQVATSVPNGIVVFLPSFFFLSKLKIFLEKNKFADLIKKSKKMFFDNKDENILDGYCASSLKPGAMLFAVVRGKLSEGINFSDHLGRCIIMVGMPYLNRNDLEIRERMAYLDSSRSVFSGKMYYEASCHKAINQSIGRAIRHKNDYAVILLVDERHQSCINRRPEWMLGNIIQKGEPVPGAIKKFFSHK